jgi:hypothetical protein
MANDSKLFDWYRMLTDLGRFEVEHGRTRFYETAKLHLAVAAGILALGSYSIAEDEARVLILVGVASVFGFFNAIAWIKQVNAATTWEARWYLSAAEIEDSKEFRALVESKVKAWSHPDVRARLNPSEKTKGAAPSAYRSFVHSLMVFYAICLLLAVLAGSK